MGKNPWKSHGLLLMEISWNFSVRDTPPIKAYFEVFSLIVPQLYKS